MVGNALKTRLYPKNWDESNFDPENHGLIEGKRVCRKTLFLLKITWMFNNVYVPRLGDLRSKQLEAVDVPRHLDGPGGFGPVLPFDRSRPILSKLRSISSLLFQHFTNLSHTIKWMPYRKSEGRNSHTFALKYPYLPSRPPRLGRGKRKEPARGSCADATSDHTRGTVREM